LIAAEKIHYPDDKTVSILTRLLSPEWDSTVFIGYENSRALTRGKSIVFLADGLRLLPNILFAMKKD